MINEKNNFDYSKYLGPDWKPTYDSPSSYVCNHSCWLDVLGIFCSKETSLVGKEEIRQWPMFGLIGTAIGNFFLDRAGTKEERLALVTKIAER